jgi:hypothetical protein
MRHGESEGERRNESEQYSEVYVRFSWRWPLSISCVWTESDLSNKLIWKYVTCTHTKRRVPFPWKLWTFVCWYCLREWWSLCGVAVPYLSFLFPSAFHVQLSSFTSTPRPTSLQPPMDACVLLGEEATSFTSHFSTCCNIGVICVINLCIYLYPIIMLGASRKVFLEVSVENLSRAYIGVCPSFLSPESKKEPLCRFVGS